MTERPILFTDEMVRAIMDGRKTVTRRVIAKQPFELNGQLCYIPKRMIGWFNLLRDLKEPGVSPFGVKGDRLWVREAWSPINIHEIGQHIFNDGPIPDRSQILYRAGRRVYAGRDAPPGYNFDKWPVSWSDDVLPKGSKWRPSIHMFRKDSRIDLEILDVGVERLQQINEEDVVAEGLRAYRCQGCGYSKADCQNLMDHNLCSENDPPSSIPRFQELWDSINLYKAPWSSNPWVWRVEFRRLD